MRRICTPVLFLLLSGGASGAAAQGTGGIAQAWLEGSIEGGSVMESTAGFAGMAGLLSLQERFAFGAAGSLMLGSTTVENAGAGSDLDLRLAYGGALIQVLLAGSESWSLAVRALIGAGNAKLEDTVYGLEIGADNFGVLEPEILGYISVAGPLQVGFGAGYRQVFGVDDLPGVGSEDLRGPTAKIRIAVRMH